MEIINTPHLIASLSTANKHERRAVKESIQSYLDDERGSWSTEGEFVNKKQLSRLIKDTGLFLADQIYVQPIGIVLGFEEVQAYNIPEVTGDVFKDVVVPSQNPNATQSVNTLQAGSACLVQYTFKTYRKHNAVGYCAKKAAFHFLNLLNLANRAFTLEHERDYVMSQDTVTIKFVTAYCDPWELMQVWNESQELIDDVIDSERNIRPNN